MKSFLNYLQEAKIAKGKDKVVVSFGRFNPLTNGHEKLAEKVSSEAKKRKALPILFTSSSNDPKKNPLKFNDKTKLMKKAFPYLQVSNDSSLKNLFQIAGQLSDEGVKEFTLVVGSDRVEEFKKALGKYVGAKSGALQLDFDKFEVVSAGQRDPNAKDVSGMSASKMRALVADGDKESFAKGLPTKLVKDSDKIFDMVKKGMGINESLNEISGRGKDIDWTSNEVSLIKKLTKKPVDVIGRTRLEVGDTIIYKRAFKDDEFFYETGSDSSDTVTKSTFKKELTKILK